MESSTYLRSFRFIGCTRDGQPEWFAFIRRVNELAKGRGEDPVFDKPDHMGPWWAGGTVEEYPEARIIFRPDGTESIQAKSERAAQLFDQAYTDVISNSEGTL